MNMPIDLLLDECLEKIHQGESLENCLAAHPLEAQALRPLLLSAAALNTVPPQRSSETVYQKGRVRMFAMIAQEFPAPAVSENAFSRYSVRIITWITGKENIDMKLATRLAIAFLLVLVVFAGLGTTAVSARNALPGDLLYSLKTTSQDAQLILTWNTAARQTLEHHFQEEYRNDVRLLMQNGRQAQVRFVGTLDGMENTLWVVGGLPVSVDPSTAITGNPQPGDVVLVEAAVQKDGAILATRLSVNTPGGHHLDNPQSTPDHTAVPEHHQEDLEHAGPSATLEPTSTQAPQLDPTATVSSTLTPVHHQDGTNCQSCGGSSGTHDGGYDDHHDDHHDEEHDH
jgi:hypothetical protein